MGDTIAAAEAAELIAVLEQRSAMYALLARLYEKEPDQNLLDEMFSLTYPVSSGNADMDTGNHLIAVFLSNMWTETLSELARDYSGSFISQGLDSFSAAYPYESVYTSEERLIMQEARDAVVSIYRSCGFKKDEANKECEDHIALELQFVRMINDRTIKALSDGDTDEATRILVIQKDFVSSHLHNWVPQMMVDLRKFAETKMYQGLAYLTEGFIEVDQQFLKELLVEEA